MIVAVLSGGRSSEHDVSLASGEAVRSGLERAGHDAIDVRVQRDGRFTVAGEGISVTPGQGLLGADAAFPILHGPFGEDGTVQGLLECLGVPYVGADVQASALCMDKILFKEVVAHSGLPQVLWVSLDRGRWDRSRERLESQLADLGLPVFVKPARLGSSVGIAKVSEPAGLEPAIAAAFEHDPRVIVEAMAAGIEVECSVLGDTRDPSTSEPGEISYESDWYDYEAKYTPGGMELVLPARISDQARERVRELAALVFSHVGCHGLARADFFVDGDAVLVNELNTLPGFTETSVYGKLWEASGIGYTELLDRLVRLARDRHRARAAVRF